MGINSAILCETSSSASGDLKQNLEGDLSWWDLSRNGTWDYASIHSNRMVK